MPTSPDRSARYSRRRGRGLAARRAAALVACGPLVVFLVAGCGNSAASSSAASAPSATAQSATASLSQPASSTSAAAQQTTAEKVPVANITVKSTVSLDPLPPRYTCDGANVSLPLSWSQVPAGTREVDLFVVSALPVKGKFRVAWALAGLRPSVHQLTAGAVPVGVIVGRNSFGQNKYSLCPPKGSTARYAVLLYAVPRRVAVKPGFDAEALFEGKLVHIAPSEGEMSFVYKRK